MNTHLLTSPGRTRVDEGRWQVDRKRSRVEFHVRNLYGLVTVKGHFARFDGTLDLSADPAVELTIDAASLDTGNARRDRHLRSADFLDAERHPRVRFTSISAAGDGDSLKVRGRLEAAGERIPLELEAAVRAVDGELEVEAVTYADHRRLGMTWSPLGMVRAPSKLIVRARLTREAPARR